MISVTILTKDNAKHMASVLESVQGFDEVIVYDTGSTDETVSLASGYSNVVVHHGQLEGFGPTHNRASSLAKHDWILSIDSDEVVTAEMAEEIRQLQLDSGVVYSFPRRNLYNGKWIKGCGWHPDRVLRLYHRKQTQFSDDHVHEAVKVHGLRRVDLLAPIEHTSYTTTTDFLAKMQTYSTLFAEQNRGKKRATLWTAISHALFTFIKCYFFKRGIFLGAEGFIISIYNANTAFYKYLKLREINRLD